MFPIKRILIVGEEKPDADRLVEMLEGLGHAAETAGSGIEALEQLHADVDLVLLNAAMPGMDGYEAARQIRCHAAFGDVPIIMVMDPEEHEDRLFALQSGANDFLIRPVDALDLRVRTHAQLAV